jgi:hypothetical protein
MLMSGYDRRRQRRNAVAPNLARMKTLFKIVLLAALTSAIVNTLRRTGILHDTRRARPTRERSSIDDVPVVQPVRDAVPNIEEPLQDADLRVAQNAPF